MVKSYDYCTRTYVSDDGLGPGKAVKPEDDPELAALFASIDEEPQPQSTDGQQRPPLSPPPTRMSAAPAIRVGKAVPKSADGFPLDCAEAQGSGDVLLELVEICRAVSTPDDYARMRGAYCNAAVQLNLEGLLAPAGRPHLRVSASKGHPVHLQIVRDELVVDYHWCHATGMEVCPDEAQHAALFDRKQDFRFEEAWKLSCRSWTGAYRAGEAMGLTIFEQCQTKRLHGIELVQRIKATRSGYRDSKGRMSSKWATAMRELREWTERKPNMKPQLKVYECLWIARELLDASNRHHIPRLLALMLGSSVLDRKTIKDKLAVLSRNVSV